jgi:hypothetical protein
MVDNPSQDRVEERMKAGEYLGSALEICMRLAFRHKRDFPELTFMSDAIAKALQIVTDTENQIRLRETHAFIEGYCRKAGVESYGFLPPDEMQKLGADALAYAGTDELGNPVPTARDEVLEEAALVVDHCNREGPYNAIGAASRIRALKKLSHGSVGQYDE